MSDQKSNTWLWGCGIGCLVSLFILGAIVGGMVFFGYKGLQSMKPQISEMLHKGYQDALQKGQVPAEQQSLIEELIQYVDKPDSPIMMSSMVAQVLREVLQRGSATPEEVTAMQKIRDFLRENPRPSFKQTGEFWQKLGPPFQNMRFDQLPQAESTTPLQSAPAGSASSN